MSVEEDILAVIARNVTASGGVFRTLLERCAHVAMNNGAANVNEGLYDRKKCLARGRSFSSAPILSDAVTVFSAAVPVVLEAPLPGFGPVRLKFALQRAVEHHQAWVRVVHTLRQMAGSSAERPPVTHRPRENRVSLKAAPVPLIASVNAPPAGLRPLQIASETLLQRAEQSGDWASALAAMTVSREVLDRVAADADEAAQGARAQRPNKADLKRAWDELNTLDGITWFHLEELSRSFDRARLIKRDVPRLPLESIRAVSTSRA